MSASTPPPAEARRTRRRGMFWPLVLIAVGVVFLLGNYGLIQPVSFLALLALWPVLLVLLGIDIAFARRWPIETLAAEVAIIGLALLLAASAERLVPLATAATDPAVATATLAALIFVTVYERGNGRESIRVRAS